MRKQTAPIALFGDAFFPSLSLALSESALIQGRIQENLENESSPGLLRDTTNPPLHGVQVSRLLPIMAPWGLSSLTLLPWYSHPKLTSGLQVLR
ncbi:hypothetical protein EI94DRAFT_1729708 [Lactarius quietus]|nr:hypothetical protein EI94DRAFT_1729708 [Lactarius quietus]